MKTIWLLSCVTLITLSGITNPAAAALPPEKAESAETTPAPKRFTFADVNRRAAALAAKPFEEETAPLPAPLIDLNYDQYRDIRFRPEQALWRNQGLPFEVQFFHRGLFFTRRVKINTVEDGEVTQVPYSKDLFDYGRNVFAQDLPSDLGFAGFRLHYPLHRDNYYDEVAVFLGASYFRAVGQNQNYGLSARALAIDTGLPKAEEFPFFREFWIEKPEKDATSIAVYALLDSPSAAGAYRFTVRPGQATVMDIKSQIYMRNEVQKLGIAPLTSMFYFGEAGVPAMDDYRPEVHDSDGLQVAAGNGEWIWRPLDNPRELRVSSFQDTTPRGFGLLQRDREFDHYQDLEAHYQTRPSAWIEPLSDWGKGAVQLIEIPSDAEKYDNIVSLWVPEQAVQAGQQLSFDYRLSFFLDKPNLPPGGKTLATRLGRGGFESRDTDRRKFVIDFGGDKLKALPKDAPVKVLVSTSGGKVVNKVAQYNPYTEGWRAIFELEDVEPGTEVNLRCFLKSDNNVLTETWTYPWVEHE